MTPLAIFGLQLILSLIVSGLFAKWYVAPWLAKTPIHVALIALIFPHSMRHIGLAFLVPGLVAQPLPSSFAFAAAYGDFVSGLLAILGLIALRGRWSLALPLVWLFNIVGTIDLMNALRQADAVPHLQTTWYIPTFFVPLLLVTHALIFVRLIRHAVQQPNSHVESVERVSAARKLTPQTPPQSSVPAPPTRPVARSTPA